MKIRSGFVSNSSSSSFILIGHPVSVNYEKAEEKYEDIQMMAEGWNLSFHSGSEDGVEGEVLGYRLADGEGYLDCSDYLLDDLQKIHDTYLKGIDELVKEEIIEVLHGGPRLYIGTRMC